MVILDTDHISLLQWDTSGAMPHLYARLDRLPLDEIAVTIVSFEEQTRGWLGYMARARTLAQQVEAYRRLHKHLEDYQRFQVLPFDEPIAVVFQRLQGQRIGIGTMDLRIAAIALTHNATLLSRNLVDFRRVPGLLVEDWSV